jgi:riboflavin kinase
MSSAFAFPATHARALGRSRLGPRPLVARSIRPVRVSSRPALRAARAAADAVVDKAAHNDEQSALRDEMVSGCTECTMPFESERASALANAALADHTRLSAIAKDASERDDGCSKMALRALVVGAETGKLSKALLETGATHVLVLDHSRLMLDRAAEQFDGSETPGVVGTETGARFARADVCDVPAYQGPFDVVVFNDSLRHQADPAEALRRAVLLTRPGARVVVSERVSEESTEDDENAFDVDALVEDLPLQSIFDDPRRGKTMMRMTRDDDSSSESDETSPSFTERLPTRTSETYLDHRCGSVTHTYEVPPLFKLRDEIVLNAPVVEGFGRGSRLMGVPTANLDPAVLEDELAGMRRGVYFGYARLPEDAKHGKWCKCVVNVGARPTFADGEGVTVEVHALRDFGRDFYGENMEVVVLGFLRPEMRFDGLSALVARIMADIGLARGALDERACRERVDETVGFQASDE